MVTILRRSLLLFTLLSLFCAIWGAKLWTVAAFGSDIPNWDQWDAEAAVLYLPYFYDQLGIENFFHPHNEHRIVFTQLMNLGLLQLNGQWDSRLQCVVNAGLHASLAALVWYVLRRNFTPGAAMVLLVAVLGTFGVPYAMQNVLGGFHSQQYFLLWFSLAAIYLLLSHRVLSWKWWMGGACAISANFTMGSGVFAGTAVIGTLVIASLRDSRRWRTTWPTLLIAGVALVVGIIARAPAENHVHLRARSLYEFLLTCAYCLEWPFRSSGWMGFFCYAPLVGFAAWFVARKRQIDESDQTTGSHNFDAVLFAVLGWYLLQIFATGYARGADTPTPASRYLDTLSLGLLISAVCLIRLGQIYAQTFRSRLFARIAAVVWFLVIGTGLTGDIRESLRKLYPDTRGQMHEREKNLRAYVATGSRAHLTGKEIPYPSEGVLIDRLSHRVLRDILPATVREPIALRGSTGVEVFRRNYMPPAALAWADTRAIGSYSPSEEARATGRWTMSRLDTVYPYVEFELAGTPNDPGIRLNFKGQSGGDTQLHPRSEIRWSPFVMPVDPDSTVVEAIDESTTGWIALGAPREMARLSFWARQTALAGKSLMHWGLVMLALSAAALTWAVLRLRPNPAPFPLSTR